MTQSTLKMGTLNLDQEVSQKDELIFGLKAGLSYTVPMLVSFFYAKILMLDTQIATEPLQLLFLVQLLPLMAFALFNPAVQRTSRILLWLSMAVSGISNGIVASFLIC